MQLWKIAVFFIGCFPAFAVFAPLTSSVEELFRKQMNEFSEIKVKMECRLTFRKVDVRNLLLESIPSEIVAQGHYGPRELFVPTCSNICSHCDAYLGMRQKCTATAEEEKTFYIRYGRRRPHNFHLHKQKIAKECQCQPV